MCQALQELDIKSRAAESIIDEWQGPIVCEDVESAAKPGLVRFVWKIDKVLDLLLQAVEAARRVPEMCAQFNIVEAVDEGESTEMITTLQGFIVSMTRLRRTIQIAKSIVEVLKVQGLAISRAADLDVCPEILSGIIEEAEQFLEVIGWEEINQQALPLSEFKELAAHLVETGKASA